MTLSPLGARPDSPAQLRMGPMRAVPPHAPPDEGRKGCRARAPDVGGGMVSRWEAKTGCGLRRSVIRWSPSEKKNDEWEQGLEYRST